MMMMIVVIRRVLILLIVMAMIQRLILIGSSLALEALVTMLLQGKDRSACAITEKMKQTA